MTPYIDDDDDVQYVVDKNGRIHHVVSGVPGASHDKTAIEWSDEFIRFLNTLPADTVVLGDPAYRNVHPRIVTTFVGRSRNLPRALFIFNNQCTRLRQIVERSNGATELEWRIRPSPL